MIFFIVHTPIGLLPSAAGLQAGKQPGPSKRSQPENFPSRLPVWRSVYLSSTQNHVSSICSIGRCLIMCNITPPFITSLRFGVSVCNKLAFMLSALACFRQCVCVTVHVVCVWVCTSSYLFAILYLAISSRYAFKFDSSNLISCFPFKGRFYFSNWTFNLSFFIWIVCIC